MISDYHLVRRLVKLKSFHQLQQATLQHLKSQNYHKSRIYRKFLTSSASNLVIFNRCFSVFGEFQAFEITDFVTIINDFNLLVASLMPVFQFQIAKFPDYAEIQAKLFHTATSNQKINQWYNEGLVTESAILEFLTLNQLVPTNLIEQINSLCYVTGKIFECLTSVQNPHEAIEGYHFGYYLMLFYLLDFETRQVLINHNLTNWNLKAYFDAPALFTFKLQIIDHLTKSMMTLNHKNFNLYWRVINFVLTKSYE